MAVQLRINVPQHSLIRHWLGVARDGSTPSPLFRTAMTELGRWLTYEAMRDESTGSWLPTRDERLETPLGNCSATFIDPDIPVAVIPILRAGLTLLEGAQGLLPLARVYHIGVFRNEETLQPTCYLNKLPNEFSPSTRVLISEPMMATGGTIGLTLEELVNRGVNPSLIRIISVVVAPPALQTLAARFPSLNIYTAAIDEQLNEQGFIVPGLGDAGDRAFGT